MNTRLLVVSILTAVVSLFGAGGVLAQEGTTVTGTVTDSTDGQPLPGANIVVKGTPTGTSAGPGGEYELLVPSLQDTLRVSFVGYQSRTIPLNGRSRVDVAMKLETITGDEAVVVAFGEKQKQDVVGSVSTVGAEELSKVPTSNLTNALAGQVAGVISYQRSGEPGENTSDFFVRGVSTFGYKKDPLILIDGVESSSRDLSRLEPDDIDSFSILKDATATSLYGSRAANGVVLVETKEGKQGAPDISLRLENSISTPVQEVELADPVRYMELNNEAVLTRNPLGVLPYSQKKIDNTRRGSNPMIYPSVDWREELFKNYTSNQRFNLSVRGGGNVATYYVSGSISQDNGILKVDPRNSFNNNIDLKNYSLRASVNVNLTDRTQLAVKLNGSFDDYNGPINGGGSVYRQVMRSSPVDFQPVYPKTERFQFANHPLFGNAEDKDGSFMRNPYAEMVRGFREYSRSVMNAQLELTQDLSFLTDGLTISAMMNTRRNSYFSLSRSFQPFWYRASPSGGERGFSLNPLNPQGGTEFLNYNPGFKKVSNSFYFESQLTYNTKILDKHSLDNMLVLTARHEITGNAPTLQQSLPRHNLNLAGRLTYSYDSRYYAEFNFAYNGSERFARENRFGFFPSFGVSWRISNEPFWEPLEDIVNNLQIRSTFGLSGNDAIASRRNRFLYLSEVDLNDPNRGATFGEDFDYSRNGMSLSRYSNPAITWERSQKLNVSLDVGLFERLDLSTEFFREYRNQILQARKSIPASMGLQATTRANIGAAVNRGVDASLTYNHSFGTSTWLQVRGNFTFARSEYRQFEELEFEGAPWKSRIGYPISQRWGYIAERLFVDDEEAENSPQQNFGPYSGGDIKYRDVNGDGRITTLDQVPIGYPTSPEIVYGFGFSFGHKGFDVSAFFQGLARESFWVNPEATAPFVGDKQLLKAYADDHWSEDDRDLYALWPRLSTTSAGNSNNSQTSTWFMRNGAFLRLKQVELGYDLPTSIKNTFSMEELRVYVSGRNLALLSVFDLWDVEMAGNGLGYPLQRVFNVGIEVSF
jgi:TonB-linked SusC/RagA family outer membrane protein